MSDDQFLHEILNWKMCHSFICSDFELADFIIYHHEAAIVYLYQIYMGSYYELLNILLQYDTWKSLSASIINRKLICFVIFLNIWLHFQAHILLAKRHSADVKRLISYNYVIKTPKRSSLALDIIFIFVFLYK